MNINSANWFNPNWFNTKTVTMPNGVQGQIAVPKAENWEDIRKAMAEHKASEDVALQNYRAEPQRSETVKLTDEQKAALSEKYDPTDMTREDYTSFVDDLYDYGILQGDDRDWLQAGNSEVVYVDVGAPAHQQIDLTNPAYAHWNFRMDFASSGGNVLEWAKFMSGFESFSQVTMDFEPTRSAFLFGKIEDILRQLAE